LTRESGRREQPARDDTSLPRRLARGLKGLLRRRRQAVPKGALAERMVAGELARRRYKVLARNFSTRYGEVDLIARKGRTIVFVEVKGRARADAFAPADAVNARKRKKIVRTAQCFLARHHMDDADVRFDVAEVVFGESGGAADIHIIEDAFHAGD